MGRYFLKKRIFALIFFITVFTFAGINIYNSYENIVNEWNADADSRIDDRVKAVEGVIDEGIYARDNFVETFSYINVLLAKDEISDFTYIKDKEGYLFYSAFFRENYDEEFQYALRVKRLKAAVSKYGTKVIFVVPPDKYIPGKIEFSEGLPVNDVNPKTDELLLWLNRLGIETIDYREYLPNEVLTYDETFYKTDHHWRIPAAFMASRILMEELNYRFEGDFNLQDPSLKMSSYNVTEYPDSMVGSMGKKTGINYSGLDDFIFIEPKFSNEYEYVHLGEEDNEKYQRGSIYETLIDYEHLEGEIGNKYNVYMGGLNYYDSVKNMDNSDAPKALFIRDSYASPMMTFLAPLFSQIDAVWCLEDRDDLSIEDIVESNTYDYIIIELYPYNINDEAFNYYK